MPAPKDTLDELLLAVGRIEGKLEAFSDIPHRVSALENWKSKVIGVCAVVAAVVTAGCNYLATHWNIKT